MERNLVIFVLLAVGLHSWVNSDISVPVIRSVSKLVASFITFYRTDDPSLGYEYANKRICRFFHLHQSHDSAVEGIYDINKDLEFQIQLGSKLYPENIFQFINSVLLSFTKKALNLSVFHQPSIVSQLVLGSIGIDSLFSVSHLKKSLIAVIQELTQEPDNRC